MGNSSSTPALVPSNIPTVATNDTAKESLEQANEFLKQNYLLQSGFGTTYLKDYSCKDAYSLFLEKNEKYFEELERYESFLQLQDLYSKQSRVKTAVQYQRTPHSDLEIETTMQKQKLIFAQELAMFQKLIYESCLLDYYSQLETPPTTNQNSKNSFSCFSNYNYNELATQISKSKLVEFLEEPHLSQIKSIQKCFRQFDSSSNQLSDLFSKYSISEKSAKQVFTPYLQLDNCNLFADAQKLANTERDKYILQRNWETCQLIQKNRQVIEKENLMETMSAIELLQKCKQG